MCVACALFLLLVLTGVLAVATDSHAAAALDPSTRFANAVLPRRPEPASAKRVFLRAQDPVLGTPASWSQRALDWLAATLRRPPPASRDPRGPVLCLTWNAHRPLGAAAAPNDTVYVYSLEKEAWLESVPLHHPQQRGVREAAWRPAGHDLAVACDGAVCVWSLQPCDPSVLALDDFVTASVRVFPTPHGEAARVLAWSSCGTYLAWAGDRGIGVWDVNAREHLTLAPLAGASVLAFSHDNTQLVVGGAGDGVVWVYDCINWHAAPQQWRCNGPALCAAVWHLSSASVALFVRGEAAVHIMQRLPPTTGHPTDTMQTLAYSASFELPGVAVCAAASPCGRRLCVGLRGMSSVAVIECSDLLRLYPVGILHGPDNCGQAEHISFKEAAKGSASPYLLCCIVWASGVISFTPMFID